MSEHTDVKAVRQQHLPHDGQELPGATPPDARSAEDAERNAEDMIRALVVEQKRRTSPDRLPKLAPQVKMEADAEPDLPLAPRRAPATDTDTWMPEMADMIIDVADPASPAPQPAPQRHSLRFPLLRLPCLRIPSLPSLKRRRDSAEAPSPSSKTTRRAPRLTMPRLRIPQAVRSYRPTPRHLGLAVLALIVVMRPLLLPIVAMLLFWLSLIVYLTLGPERCSEMGRGLWTRFSARRPEAAERLRCRADAFAERFDRLLERLPERWADRLALPDFSAPAIDEADLPDPFDRLRAQTRDV